MKVSRIIAIILVILGISFTFTPVLVYYTGSYSQDQFHDQFTNGVKFDYVILETGANSIGEEWFGFVLNFTYMGGFLFELNDTLYSVTGSGISSGHGLPGNPFTGNVSLVKSESKQLNWNNSEILQTFFPRQTVVKTSMLQVTISSETKAFGPFTQTGYAIYRIGSDPNVTFIQYRDWYVLGGEGGNSVNYSSLFTFLGENNSGISTSIGGIYIGLTNDAPVQDWQSWIIVGYYQIFPFNLALIAAGIVIGLVSSRRR